MPTCTFFGHRECPQGLRPGLYRVVEGLIREEGVDTFYVGSQGQFDAMALGVLRQLAMVYPHIRYGVVLAYLPGPGEVTEPEAMVPEGLETVPPRYAISRRNDWMLARAEYVVTYITHSWGGAARFGEKARRLGKRCIPLYSPPGCQSPPGQP